MYTRYLFRWGNTAMEADNYFCPVLKSKMDQNRETLRSTTPSPFRWLLHVLVWFSGRENDDPAKYSRPFRLYNICLQNFVSGVNISSRYQINLLTAYEQLIVIYCLCFIFLYIYLLVMLLSYIQFYMLFHFLICAVRSRGHGKNWLHNQGQCGCGLWKEVQIVTGKP